MSCNENTPINNTTTKTATPVIDTSHEDEPSASRNGNTLANLMGPLTSWLTNASSPRPLSTKARHSPEVTPRSDEEPPSSPQHSIPDQECSDHEDKSIPSDAELSEVGSAYAASDEDDDDYDFTYEDDDDLPLDSDPFFGDTPTKLPRQRKSDQPTEEQLEAIRQVLEEDKNKAAIERALRGATDPTDLTDLELSYPLIKDQNHNATEMLIQVRSSFGGDVFYVIGMKEPLLEIKLKFIKAHDLPQEALHELEFLCGYHAIKDDDTAEKVCYPIHYCAIVQQSLTRLQLKIGTETIIYCQKIGDVRYDLPPEPATTPELVSSVFGEEADALDSASVHEEEADVPNSPGW